MPRAYDPSLPGGGLPITHSPLNRMRHNVIPQELDLEKITEDLAALIEQQLTDFLFPAIYDLTGIDLGVFLPLLDVLELDFSSPDAFLHSLADAIIAAGTALLGPNSPLNAENLFNVIAGALIPGLDATKIVSGIFPQSMVNITSIAAGIVSGVLGLGNIPGLPTSQITSGTFLATFIPGLDASKIVSGQFPQAMVNITSIAAGIISGVLGTGNIPGLPASQITSGTFLATLIPGLDASKITSGTFAQAMTAGLPGIVSAFSGTRAGQTNLASDPDASRTDLWSGTNFNNATTAVSSEQAYSGTTSVKMVSTTTNNMGIDIRRTTAGGAPASASSDGILVAAPGDKFYAEARVRAHSAVATVRGVYIFFYCMDSAGVNAPVSFGGTPVTPTKTDWSANPKGEYTIPAGYDRLRILVFTNTGLTVGDAYYVDNMVLKEVTPQRDITQWLNNTTSASGSVLATVIPGLDATKITTGQFPQAMLNITSIAAGIITGALSTANIPGLDAAKIISGAFAAAQIPGLDASKVTTGTFGTGLIPILDAATKLSGTAALSLIPGLPTSKITSGTFPQSMLDITAIAAGIITGSLAAAQIPSLDASKITTGQFAQSMVNITSIAAGIVSGVLATGNIPGLDAAKITSGVFPQAMVNITSIAAGIVSGVLGTGNIPALDATKITTGTFAQSMITNLATDLGLLLPKTWFNKEVTTGSNLLQDPGFEDATFWVGALSGAVSTEQKRSGTQSWKMAAVPGSYISVALNQGYSASSAHTTDAKRFQVQPGEKYYGEIWYYAHASNVNAGGGIVRLQAAFYDSTGVNTAQQLGFFDNDTVPVTTGAWVKLSGYITVPAGRDRMVPYAELNNAFTNPDVFYFDDALMREETQAQNIVAQLYGGTSILSSILATSVPALDASKVTTGTFAQTMVTNLVTDLSNRLLSSIFDTSVKAGSNLAYSPDMEDATVARSPYGGASITHGYTTAEKFTGTRSYSWTITALGNYSGLRFIPSSNTSILTYKVLAGETYKASARIKAHPSNGTGGSVNIYLRWTSSTGTPAGFVDAATASGYTRSRSDAALVAAADWMEVSNVGTCPALYDTLEVMCISSNLSNVGNTYYIDALELREVTAPQSIIQGLYGGPSILSAITATSVPGLDASKIITGIFGTGLIPGLDAAKIISGAFGAAQIPGLDSSKIVTGQFAQSQITNLTSDLASLFTTVTTPLADWLMPLVPVSHVGLAQPNLLANPNYATAASVSGAAEWIWDGTVDHDGDGSGSVKVVANGAVHQLFSDPAIPVAPNQTLALSHWLRWTGVAGTGVCFRLDLISYNAANAIVATTTIASTTNPAASSGWVQLAGTHTVAAGVTSVRLGLIVTAAATAGTINWDSGSVTKTQLLAQDWTTALVGDLSNLGTQVSARALLTDFNALMSNLGLGTATLTAITNRFTKMGSTGLFDAAGLTNMVGFPSIDATKILTGILNINRIPTSQFDRTNITDLGSITDHVLNGLLGTGSQFTSATPAEARGGLDSIYGEVLNANAQLAAMQSNEQGADVSGVSVNINFTNYADGALPSMFTVTYSGVGTSTIGVTNGIAGWRSKVNDGNRNAVIVYNAAPTGTDFQLVRGTLASPPPGAGSGGTPRISAIGRVDNPANPQNYVWARGYCTGFLTYRGDIGCTINGVETVWASNIALTWSMQISMVIGVGTNARRYQVFSGSTLVYDHTEVGTSSLLGAGYRYWGCRTEIKTGSNGANDSPGIASTSVTDNAPPDVVGSGAHITRRSTTAVGMANGINSLPANFFSNPDYQSSDIAVNLTNGTFTVTYAGWYMVDLCVYLSGAIFEDHHLVLYKNGVHFKDGAPVLNEQSGDHDAWIVYLAAGDTVNGGTSRDGGSNAVMRGDANGRSTYLTIALLNRSYA